MIIEGATKQELYKISIVWGRGQLFRQIQARQVQLANQDELNKIEGTVKLTKKVKLKPNQSLKVSGKRNHPLNSKRVNVIVESTGEEDGEYTIPSYSFLKSNSKQVMIGLRNMSCQTITLHKCTVVARLSPANVFPEMLAPKLEPVRLASCQLKLASQNAGENSQSGLNSKLTRVEDLDEVTRNQIDKLFSKLDLSGCSNWTERQQQAIRECIIKHHKIFAVEDKELGWTDLVKHKIKLDNYVPFKERYRRIPPHQYEEVKKHLTKMLEIGAIRRSESPWASAVVLVRKKDGSLRFCIDLRKLNSRTVKDAYSIPRIEDSLDSLNGSCIFTSIDLKAGYWQVELDEHSIPLTAFTVGPLGFYECVRMPFGLTNAPTTFQHLMENCLGDLHLNWCIIYLDDVVIFSRTPEEHLQRLDAVFTKIRKAGLKLKPSKCEFFKKWIAYLGHIVSDKGIETDPKKIEAIVKWPIPETVHDVRSFLRIYKLLPEICFQICPEGKAIEQINFWREC